MIKCKMRKMPEFSQSSKQERFGRYHGSNFWDIPEFGSKRWVVGAYLELDFDSLNPRMTEDEILKGCVEFLNTPPPRKKYQRKKPKPTYGVLAPYKCQIVERHGEKLLSALLITKVRKNKLFWSEGNHVPTKKRK